MNQKYVQIWTQYAKYALKYAKVCTKIYKIYRSAYFECICTHHFASADDSGRARARAGPHTRELRRSRLVLILCRDIIS